MSGDLKILRLPENLAVMAGAGAGKTHTLVSMALHLLVGAREGGVDGGGTPLPAARLCALTFTEKAAAEMKLRLRRRLMAMVDAGPEKLGELEPELDASLAHLGLERPSRESLRALADELPLATVGTFHSFCAQLLRRWPAEAGVDPEFRLAEDAESRGSLESAVESTLLEALEGGGDWAEKARAVIRNLGFAGVGEHGQGARELLAKVHLSIAEEGKRAEDLLTGLPSDAEAEAAVREASQAVLEAIARCALDSSQVKLHDQIQTTRILATRLRSGGITLEELAKLPKIALNVGSKKTADERKALKEAIQHLHDCLADAAEAPLVKAFVDILERVERRHSTEKRRRRMLDFSDLLIFTRNLLRDFLQVRVEAQARVGVLLVDELQDTNPLQMELVMLLCERRVGGPRQVEGRSGALELPLEPRSLVAVGDRKQSIYEFRGAEVALFSDLGRRLVERSEGRVTHLTSNWRSRPALIGFYNRLFARSMAPPSRQPHGFEVCYHPDGDNLVPRRGSVHPGPCAELLAIPPVEGALAAQVRWREACAVAQRLSEVLSPHSGITVGDPARPARGGDIAILLRRFTYLDVFRRALVARSIPFVVVQGRGFYGAQEVMDLAQLLRIVDEPEDTLAWAAALRSPLVGLTDSGMLRMARQGSLAALVRSDWEPPPGLQPFEVEAVARFRTLIFRLGRDADRLRPSGCLLEAIDQLDLRAVLAAGFQGEQAVANIDKLVEWAREREAQGLAGAGTLGRELLVLSDTEPREAQAPSLEEGDPRAVRLMTIHQSKGLEFPVVFVPECGATERFDNDVALYDRELGLSVRPRDPRGDLIPTRRSQRIGKRLRDRVAAESSRLFYVALTRARDRLVLSGETDSATTWRNQLDRFVTEEPDVDSLLLRREMPVLAPGTRSSANGSPEPDAAQQEQARSTVERVFHPPPARVSRLTLSVTQASDLNLCPRRYLLAHEVGLAEHPRVLMSRDDGQGSGGLDPATRGTLAHALLERCAWSEVQQGHSRSLERVLNEEGQPLTPPAREIIADVEAFLRGSFARELAQTPTDRVWRELPFILSVPSGEGCILNLKGQIDLVALIEPKVALVLDYKSGSSRGHGPQAYAFQLQCYALAASQLLGEDVEIRTGLVFLKDRSGRPELRTLTVRGVEESLAQLAQILLTARNSQRWEGLEVEKCRAAGCGFAYRCHPEAHPASLRLQLKLPI